jgi:hypothetical protein
MVRRSLSAVVVAGLALLAGACGSGGGNPYGGSTPTTATPPSAASRNAAEVNPPGDIPDNQVFVAYRPPGGRFMVKVPEGWARVRQGGTVTFTDKLNTISMESRPAPAAPTVASARQAELPAIRSASRRYEYWRGGTEAILTLAGPVGADNVDPWRIVSDSFRWR